MYLWSFFFLLLFIFPSADAAFPTCKQSFSGNNFVEWILGDYAQMESQWLDLSLKTSQSERSAERKKDIQDHLSIFQHLMNLEIDKILIEKDAYPFERYQFLKAQVDRLVYRIDHPRSPEIDSTQLEDYLGSPILIEPQLAYTFQSQSQGAAKKILFSKEIVQQLFSSTRYHGADAADAFLHSILMDVPGKNIKPLHDGVLELRTTSHNYGHLRIFGFFHKGVFHAVKLSTTSDHSGKKFSHLIEVVAAIRRSYE